MKALIRFGLAQRRLLHALLAALLAYALVVVLPKIPIERYPNVDFGEAVIFVSWPGATADDIEQLVVRPLEEAIRGVDRLEFVRATARDGYCEFSIKFEDDSDYARQFDDLRLRVLAVQPRLPLHDGKPLSPTITRLETDAWLPVIQANLIAEDPERCDLLRLSQLARALADRAAAIPGMKRVEVEGAPELRAEIVLDPAALQRHAVSVDQVLAALRGSIGGYAAGASAAGGVAKTVVAAEHPRTLADLWPLPVRVDGEGRALTLGELADQAASGLRPAERGLRVHCNGRPTVSIKALKDPQARAAEVKERFQATVAAFLAERAPEGIRVVYNLDASERVAVSLGVLTSALAQGSALVLLALLVFLGWRMAVLSVTGILAAFVGTLVVMYLGGHSLNEITLIALVLVAGVLTDDVIVVVDNVRRHREEGEDPLTAIVHGTSEVFWPLIAAVTTTLASFLPLLMMSGTTGEFFRLLPITVALALLVSLAECLLITPAHIADLERCFGPEPVRSLPGDGPERYLQRTGFQGWLARRYDRVLRVTLLKPLWTVAAAFGALLLALLILVQSALAPDLGWRPILRMAFFPEDIRVVNVTLRAPAGTTLADTDRLARAIAADIAEDRQRILSVAGITGMYIDRAYRPVWGPNHAVLLVELSLAGSDQDARTTVAGLRARLEERWERAGVRLDVSPQKDGPPTDAPLVARFASEDPAAAMRAARALQSYLAEQSASGRLPGIVDLADDIAYGERIVFRADPLRCAVRGLTPQQALAFVAGANEGAYVGDLRLSDRDLPIVVRLPRAISEDPAALAEVPMLTAPDGRQLRFSDLGAFVLEEAPAQLVRRDYRRTITVLADLHPDSPLSPAHLVAAVRSWWQGVRHQYPQVDLAFGGEAEATARSLASLAQAFAIALAVIIGILLAQFRSWRPTLLVLTNIASAFVGVTVMMGLLGLACWLLPEGWVHPERASFTVQTFIAMVALAGMVVNEGLILLAFVEERRHEGLPLPQALRLAAHQRLRPILMTTLTTVAGLLPMAIGIPDFSIAWSPMATAFVAGVGMSTLLTVLVLPAAYRLIARRDPPAAQAAPPPA
ncbi:MAG: efflux RND transporter permease subunit [Planctomycetota bacterium]|nr:efflux RND transporter permease subunit [Planctomycetota bacterium]MDW8373658.1 efflux RND transporter permease subunit [Planctomycetota bacterium]